MFGAYLVNGKFKLNLHGPNASVNGGMVYNIMFFTCGPLMRKFDIFFVFNLKKLLNKLYGRLFKTLWCSCDGAVNDIMKYLYAIFQNNYVYTYTHTHTYIYE